MERIIVIGSYNADLWITGMPAIPRPGETVLGTAFHRGHGGKGSNQAVSAARLGGNVSFFARVGNDSFGSEVKELYRSVGIDTRTVKTDPEAATGAALIFIDAKAQNAIAVAPGANSNLRAADLEEAGDLFKTSRYVLTQLEIPLAIACHGARLARAAGAMAILNPAPAQPLAPDQLALFDLLTPNETEAEILTGVAVCDTATAFEAGRALRGKGVPAVIVTLGSRGCVYVADGIERHYPAPNVRAVDTVGAGDAFNGGLVYALASGRSMEEAIPFASRVAAYSVTLPGVVASLPTLNELESFFK
jgi:ribokinase